MGRSSSKVTYLTSDKFVFTLQLGYEYKEQYFLDVCNELKDKCNKISDLYQFQLEIGDQDNYHIQGFIVTKEKFKGQAIVNKLNRRIGYMQIMLSSNSFDYTCKKETSVNPALFKVTKGTKIELQNIFNKFKSN